MNSEVHAFPHPVFPLLGAVWVLTVLTCTFGAVTVLVEMVVSVVVCVMVGVPSVTTVLPVVTVWIDV